MIYLNKLWEIQGLQLDLKEKEQLLNDFQLIKNIKRQIQEKTSDLENYKKSLKEISLKKKEVELEFSSVEENIKHNNSLFLSGEIKKAKEIAKLEKQTKSFEEEKEKINEIINEQNIEYKKYDLKVQETEKIIEDLKKELEETEQKEKIKSVGLKKEIEELEKEIKKARSEVKEKYLRIFDGLSSKFSSAPIALVDNDKCSYCFIKLPIVIFEKLKSADEEIYYCEFCGKILYYKKEK